MKLKVIIVAAALLAATGCGENDNNDTTPSPSHDVLGDAADNDPERHTDTAPDTHAHADTHTDVDPGEDTAAPDEDTHADAHADADHDVDEHDVDPGEDTAEPDDDALADVDPDTDTDPEPCDEAALATDAWRLQEAPATQATLEVTTEEGVTSLVLDATLGGTMGAAASSWVYLDLTTAALAPLSDRDALASNAWHIAFKRTSIRVNGGDSGPRGVFATPLEQAFEDLTVLPDLPRGTFQTDRFISDDCELITEGRNTPKTAFGIWYDYDFQTHTASPKAGITWVIYSMDTHALWKLSIDALESNGRYSMRVAPLASRPR